MIHKSFQEMGIPEGYGHKQLLFHPAASTLVVHVEGVADWLPQRLYYRQLNQERYQPVGAPAAMTTQECPVLATLTPLLAYNTMQCSYSNDPEVGRRLTGDWDSLKIYDLVAHHLVHSISKQTLKLPEGVTDGRIASVFGFGHLDEVVYVTAGISRNKGISMEYHLASLDLANRSLHLIALLPAAFI